MGAITAAEVGAKLAAAGLAPRAEESATLAEFLNLLAHWNRAYNLTGVRTADELISRHLVESLALGQRD